MSFSLPVRIDTLRTVANASISASYVAFGSALTHRARVVKITNNTDGDMFIGVNSVGPAPASDGSADNDFVPAGGFVLYDFTSNSASGGSPFVFQQRTQFWVRQSTAPTTGDIYMTVVFAKGE